jgi:hypothetical protein
MERPLEPFTLSVALDRTDHVLGPETARVAVVEYGDFECPNCGQAYPAVKQLLQRFGHRIRFAFRHFPLARIFHQDADLWVVLGETGRARPSQPIDHSIGKTGMPEMAAQDEPETA